MQKPLPPWRIILRMIRFRRWYWLVDLFSVALVRVTWQVAPSANNHMHAIARVAVTS